MRVSLRTVRSRCAFMVVLLALSVSLMAAAGRLWLAERWDSSSDPRLWLRAAQLEPGNAEYWEQLGVYAPLDFSRDDSSRGLAYLKHAAQLNPGSDSIWMHLADAYEAAGDTNSARRAYTKAQAVYPISAEVAWRYGNFLIREGDALDGARQIRRALNEDRSLTTEALAQCWHLERNPGVLFDQMLPERSGYYETALDFFLSHQDLDAALSVWGRLQRLREPVRLGTALPLIDALIAANRTADAQRTWHEALPVTRPGQCSNRGTNLIFNSGFECQPVNGGFGWQEQAISGVSYQIDTQVAHSGTRSMSVTFDGSANLDFSQLRQDVPVDPSRRYQFTAYLRTRDITTDSGVRFAIDDLHQPSEVHVLTANLVGTNPWAVVTADITTGPHTDLLQVSLRRLPSLKFDNKLAGEVWLDDVSLVPVNAKSTGIHAR